MALQARLEIEGRIYELQDLDYRLSQPTDEKSKPAGATQGGVINFTVLMAMGDFSFHEWVCSLSSVKRGVFTLPITEGIDHYETTVEFTDAYCTDLQVFYSKFNDKQVFMKVSISATKIRFAPRIEYINKNLQK